MSKLGLQNKVQSTQILENTQARFKSKKILLPTFDQLKNPASIPDRIKKELMNVDPNEAHPLNLFRIHFYNEPGGRGFVEVPHHIVLDKRFTGIDAKIAVMIGADFPMIAAHKVLAAYGCLAPRLVTGEFDPGANRAIWPSTGNYCRGGIAVSRIMDCHGVAILPEEMSQERFNWLQKWCLTPDSDIIRTYGCESNVKEIYDECNRLSTDPVNFIFNQFCEFGNALVHYHVTGSACAHVFETLKKENQHLNLAALVSATGSAGTISAGDYLKDVYGSRIVAVEATECPTLLYNGFGGHNIQGIGDKHVPLVHNSMNTDFLAGISESASDNLFTLLNTEAGVQYLKEFRGLTDSEIKDLQLVGLSGLANILACIKTAKYMGLGQNDVMITMATDSGKMYLSEVEKAIAKYHGNKFSSVHAATVYGQYLLGTTVDHFEELDKYAKDRVFNLGYYTWVEQQGVSIEDFNARKSQIFWKSIRSYIPAWNQLIEEFNAKTGMDSLYR